ncbi:unnamed protein product [Lathyrus oleraceus]|uniref:Thaumatin-like protein n=1 Tax=Pisum sativum TaxID=3888 RepID=A0A9D5BDH6_PEA|nr:hypothetical protein KIW84_025319 [Pisum sativum]
MAITMEKSLFIFLFIAITSIASTQAGNFNITNKCNYTVWAAAVPGGGVKLNTGESWNMNIANGTNNARIWGRTNCTFDNSGVGKCQTGDCNNTLECKTFGTPPNTILEFALNMYNNLDFYDVSLVQGFNIPIKLTPSSSSCGMVNCTRNITDECPAQLKVPGGCNNPCTTFGTSEYCCDLSSAKSVATNASATCTPTNYSKFFKDRCPSAYSYPKDDATSTYTCMGGTTYDVVFCP